MQEDTNLLHFVFWRLFYPKVEQYAPWNRWYTTAVQHIVILEDSILHWHYCVNIKCHMIVCLQIKECLVLGILQVPVLFPMDSHLSGIILQPFHMLWNPDHLQLDLM
jgi:hypothetical protein